MSRQVIRPNRRDIEPRRSRTAVQPYVATLAEVDDGLYRLLKHAAPFGVGNPTPVFAARAIRLAGAPRVVGSKHLRMTLAAADARLEAIGFGMAERIGEVSGGGGAIDVAFKLEENSWNGRTELQAKLLDIRPAE